MHAVQFWWSRWVEVGRYFGGAIAILAYRADFLKSELVYTKDLTGVQVRFVDKSNPFS